MREISINSANLPVLGMGTWGFGGRAERDPENDDAAQILALQKGLEAGFTHIDTAEYYAEGHAETLVGKAISNRDRKQLFLTSKVWKTNLKRDAVLRAAEQSLKRLNTDYLDCYLYHQVNEEIPLEETIGAMNELVEQKMVRFIGVSNFSAERLMRAIRCSSAPIVMNQVHYNLAVRDAAEELKQICREQNVILQAWRPLRDLTETEVTREICRKRGITFAQLALAWLLNQENTAAITAMKNPEHLKQTMDVLSIRLSPEEMALLDAYPIRKPCTVPLK
ncbi:MAG: aldo/keto reductase [Lentisphaeria bacterium]|nr:aldo/keto reductase [Lentisphaeria bacterium]